MFALKRPAEGADSTGINNVWKAHPSRTAVTAEASAGSVRTMRRRSSTDSSEPRSPCAGSATGWEMGHDNCKQPR